MLNAMIPRDYRDLAAEFEASIPRWRTNASHAAVWLGTASVSCFGIGLVQHTFAQTAFAGERPSTSALLTGLLGAIAGVATRRTTLGRIGLGLSLLALLFLATVA